MNTPSKVLLALAISAGLLAAVLVVSLSVGPAALGFGELLRAISGEAPERVQQILFGVRLPRALLAVLVGGALSAAGAVLQAVLRNPLADPFVLGVSSGCALGAVIALGLGLQATALGLPIPAVLGGLVTVALVYGVSRQEGRLSTRRMVLAGVVASYFLAAAIMFVLSWSSGRDGGLPSERILFWLMGDFASQTARQVLWASPLLVLSAVAIYFLAPGLNLVMVDEDYAAHTGLNVERFKLCAFLLASLATGAAVAVAGSIGFVGLIVPHTVRLLIGSDHRLLLPVSVISGGAFLLMADTIARTALAPIELPVGVVTAFCGGPFFLALLARRG